MIPIVSFAHLVSVLVSCILAFRLFRHHRKNPSTTLKRFAWFYSLFAVAWFFITVPVMFLSSAQFVELIGVVLSIAHFMFLYASVAVGIYIPFSFTEKRTLGTIAVLVVVISSVVFLLGRIYYFQDQVLIIERVPPFIYWKVTFPGWLRLMTGAINAAAALIFIAIFLRLSIRNKLQPVVYYRSLALAGGMTLLFIATFFAQLVPAPTFFNLAVGAILVASGLLVMAHGVMHEHKAMFQIR